MFRIKRLALVLLCLIAPALAESENLISQDRIRSEDTHYQTAVVEIGTYERTASASAAEYYPLTCAVRFENSGARFGEYLVARGDEVKKGDALATFTVDFDEAAYSEARLKLDRLRADVLSEDERVQAELENLEMQLLGAASSGEKALIRLQIERAEVVHAQRADSLSRQIASVLRQIADMEAQRDCTILLSPMDGVVTELQSKRPGDKISKGESLLTLRRQDVMLLAVENPENAFRYGAEVIVEVSSGKERSLLSGRVVSADALAPSAERRGYALVEFDNPENISLNRMTVKQARVRVENVMLVPRRGVKMDAGKYFVTVLEDGVPQKRFINCVFNGAAEHAWVLQGLNPGDEIVLD